VEVVIDLGRHVDGPAIAVRGVLDVHSAAALREALMCLLDRAGGEPEVDVSAVEVLDDAARAALDALARHCREFGGRVRLRLPPHGRPEPAT
jgi:ABC-type transporter Mla MlaB component